MDSTSLPTHDEQRPGAAPAPDPTAEPALPAAPAPPGDDPAPTGGVSIWDALHLSKDVQETGKIVGQVIGTVSTAISWVGTVQSVLKLAGFLAPEPNPFDTLYERIQRDMRVLLAATVAGATEERLRDVAEQNAIARSAAQTANEYLLAGRPATGHLADRMVLADQDSLRVMNVLTEAAWWQRTYDPTDAARRGPAVPGGPASIWPRHSGWPVPVWAATPSGGLVWDYRHILPVYLKAVAARIVVLKARARDGNQFLQLAGGELQGHVAFLTQQRDRIDAAIRVKAPLPRPAQGGPYHPIMYSAGAVETYSGTHQWGDFHPIYVDPGNPPTTYEGFVALHDAVVREARRRVYDAVGLSTLDGILSSLRAMLVPPCGVSQATAHSAGAATARCGGVDLHHHVFVPGSDGGLHVLWRHGEEAAWQWHQAGRPPGTRLERYHRPVVVGHEDGPHYLHAFSQAADGHLRTYWWNGARWQWSDLGRPERGIAWNVTATTFRQGGARHVRAYAVGAGTLQVAWWDGASWTWHELGAPALGSYGLVGAPAVVTYRYGGRQLDDLYTVANGSLHEHWWYEDGTRGWGRPAAQPAFPGLVGTPAVVTHEVDGRPVVHAFAVGNGRLASLDWDGGWHWTEHGRPPSTDIPAEISGQPVKAASLRVNDQIWTVAVVVGRDGRLYARLHVDEWWWQDLRVPDGTTVAEVLGVTTNVRRGSFVGIDIFVRGADQRVFRTGIGFDNTWTDMGYRA